MGKLFDKLTKKLDAKRRPYCAALVAAGLQAQGITRVEQIHHIERGYADIVGDLAGLGACISRTE